MKEVGSYPNERNCKEAGGRGCRGRRKEEVEMGSKAYYVICRN